MLLDHNINDAGKKEILALLRYFEGLDRALVYIDDTAKPRLKLNVHICDLLVKELEERIGAKRIKL